MRHTPTYVALIGALVLGTGCQSAAPERVDVRDVLPQLASSPTAAAPIPADWWKQFGDQKLDGLIEEALANSPSLVAAGARVRVAAASLAASGGASDPQVTAGLNLARRRQVFIGLPIPGSDVSSSTSSAHGISLNASWELDLWGRLEAAQRGAALGVTKSLVDEQAARLALTTGVARSYFALIEARLALEIAKELESNADFALAAVERLDAMGRGSQESVLAARVALQDASNGVTEAAHSVAILQPGLAALVGRPGGKIQFGALRFGPLQAAPAAGLPATLLQRRPDLATLELDVQIAFAQAEVSHAALYPQISLSASAGTNASDLEDLLNGDFRVWSLGANLLAPILNGGQLEASKDAAVAARDAALYQFATAALDALAEVQVATANEGLIANRLGEVQLLGQKLTDLEEAAARHHRQGTGAVAVVYSIRADQLRNNRAELALQTLLRRARIDLIASLGGGFDASPTTSPDSSQEAPRENSL